MQFQVKGIPTYYEQWGERGDRVLVLHGWRGDVSTMLPIINRLKKFHRVTAVDFPAHGGTGMPTGDWGVPEYAEWLLAFIQQTDLAGCHVVAHSFGGRVALYLSAHHPQLFASLVLTGAAGLVREKTTKEKYKAFTYRIGRTWYGLLAWLPFVNKWGKPWLSKYRDKHNSADYKALPPEMRATFNKIIRLDLSPLLPRIKQKTLLIWGEKDTASPMWMAQAFHQGIAGSRLVLMPGDHFAFITYPDPFCDYALDFLEENKTA